MEINIWMREVSERASFDERNANIKPAVTWIKYQGPAGEVSFDPGRISLDEKEGQDWVTYELGTDVKLELRLYPRERTEGHDRPTPRRGSTLAADDANEHLRGILQDHMHRFYPKDQYYHPDNYFPMQMEQHNLHW